MSTEGAAHLRGKRTFAEGAAQLNMQSRYTESVHNIFRVPRLRRSTLGALYPGLTAGPIDYRPFGPDACVACGIIWNAHAGIAQASTSKFDIQHSTFAILFLSACVPPALPWPKGVAA
jgi:hypothetical protein